jgi:hypothetical protein
LTAGDAAEPGPGAGRTATVLPVRGAARLAERTRSPGPVLQGLLALAIYLAVFIIGLASPLIRDPGLPQVGQYTVDPNFYIWSLRWWPYAISHGLNPLYSHQIGAPGGYQLAWTTSVPAVSVVLAPITAAFGPIASFNLTLLLSAPLSAWVAFLAARRLTGRFWPALMAGAVFGFSSYEISHTVAGQPNLIVNLLLPLMLYLALLWRDGKLGNRVFAALLAVAMAVEFYISLETFVEMTVMWAAGLLIGFVVAGPEARRAVARLAGLAAAAYVVALVLVSPYLVYALRHSPGTFTKAAPIFSLDVVNLVVPRPSRVFWLTSLKHYATSLEGFSSDAYVGIPLLLVVLALAVLAWSSRLTRLLVVLFVLVIVLAVGPTLVIGGRTVGNLPWARLWTLPIARSVEPVRIILFGYLVLAIILALWLAAPSRNRLLLASRWILGLVAVVAVFANLLPVSAGEGVPAGASSAAVRSTNALPAFISSGAYRHYLRPGEIVVVVSDRGNAGMLFQADTDFYARLAGGFINASFTDSSGLPAPVALLRHPTRDRERRFLAYVHQAGVGAILVERAWSAPWMNVFSRVGLTGTSVGGVTIYRTPAA